MTTPHSQLSDIEAPPEDVDPLYVALIRAAEFEADADRLRADLAQANRDLAASRQSLADAMDWAAVVERSNASWKSQAEAVEAELAAYGEPSKEPAYGFIADGHFVSTFRGHPDATLHGRWVRRGPWWPWPASFDEATE